MKNVKCALLLCALFMVCLQAQTTTYTATITWVDPTNPVGTTWNVYRAVGSDCTGNPTFTRIASAVTAKTYADQGLGPGKYCFMIRATDGVIEAAGVSAPGDGPIVSVASVTVVMSLQITAPVTPPPTPPPPQEEQDYL